MVELGGYLFRGVEHSYLEPWKISFSRWLVVNPADDNYYAKCQRLYPHYISAYENGVAEQRQIEGAVLMPDSLCDI